MSWPAALVLIVAMLSLAAVMVTGLIAGARRPPPERRR